MRRVITSAVVVATLVTTGGCNLLIPMAMMQEHKRTVPPEFSKLDGKRALVLVWAEPETLFDYPYVRLELATYVHDKIRAEMPKTAVVEPAKVEDYVQRVLDADADPERVGRHFDADMVIYIELLEFQIRDPQVPDLVQAKIRASTCVYDLTAAVDEARQYELAPVDLVHPEGSAMLITQTNMSQIRQEAYVKFAEMVARKFYTWEEVLD